MDSNNQVVMILLITVLYSVIYACIRGVVYAYMCSVCFLSISAHIYVYVAIKIGLVRYDNDGYTYI